MPFDIEDGGPEAETTLLSDEFVLPQLGQGTREPDKTRTRPELNRRQDRLVRMRRPTLWAAAAFLMIGIMLLGRSLGSYATAGLAVSDWTAWMPWTCASDSSAAHASQTSQSQSPLTTGDLYLIGTGKADITGPVVEINMMGYADPKQVGSGLRQRLYARAFIVGSVSNPLDRFVYLVLDTQSGDTAVRYGILDRIRGLGAEYAALYGHHNVAVTGTHSHSGPGGWLNYLLPQITSKGFDRQGFDAIVAGAALSIQRAHERLEPGYLGVSSARVQNGSINRSLFAYLANPDVERARYNISDADDGSVETDLTLLNLRRASDTKSVGVLTWFPTHGTSMLGNNTLITGDNKGVAAYLLEKDARDRRLRDAVDDGSFVAGFSQASVGDTSPNVLGAWCEDGSGARCSFENSTCGGKAQTCHARGPRFRDDSTGTASCFEIGRRQYAAAVSAFAASSAAAAQEGGEQPVRGDWVRSFHTFHDMDRFRFALPNGTVVETCPAALGYSFAAGTSDGPGAVNFTQHGSDPSNTSPVWKAVSHLLKSPSAAQRACHGAKPILLDVGELSTPYLWTPNVVDIQVFRVGQLAIVVSPGEASTMAGRRWKQAVHDGLARSDLFDPPAAPIVVLGGPANSYTHYITTEEEYAVQRYEGASTLYGPHTLAAYINVTLQHVPYLHHTTPALPPPPVGSLPPDNSNRSLSFITGVVYDGTPLFKHFGDVTRDVGDVYRRGAPVSATFVGANPRNNLRLEHTYAAVEQLDDASATWTTVRTDADWSLVYHWRRISSVLATSEVEIVWETESWADAGTYRIRYYGDAKSLGGTVTPFEGVTTAFVVEG